MFTGRGNTSIMDAFLFPTNRKGIQNMYITKFIPFPGDDGDCDNQVGSTTMVTNTPDPYDRVYQNIPDSTHKLEPRPDCKHCGAKRFQYEPDGFCCRFGKIKLVHSEPPLELQKLYTSPGPDLPAQLGKSRSFTDVAKSAATPGHSPPSGSSSSSHRRKQVCFRTPPTMATFRRWDPPTVILGRPAFSRQLEPRKRLQPIL
jgi:hypothetical protein